MGADEDSKEGRFAFSFVEDCRKRGPGGRREADVHTDVRSRICPRQQICWKAESREGGRGLLLPCSSLLGEQLPRESQSEKVLVGVSVQPWAPACRGH